MRTLPLTYKIKRATKGLHGNVYKFPKKGAVLNQFGFNGQLKDNEIYGEGNDYVYKYRNYNPRTFRFYSVDPLSGIYPELTPYQHSSLNPIWNIEIEGLEGRRYNHLSRVKVKPTISNIKESSETGAARRKNPIISNNFWGGGLTSLLGGYRGKYIRHSAFLPKQTNVRKSSSKEPFDPKEEKEKDKPSRRKLIQDNGNPLTRLNNLDEFVNGRMELSPQYTEGTIKYEFSESVDDEGNPVEQTYQIGIVDKEGNESILIETTTSKKGSLNADFKLKEGEVLFQRRTGENNVRTTTKTSATREVEDDENNE